MSGLRIILAASALAVMFATPSAAQAPKWIGTEGNWSSYTFEESGNIVCYMASVPTKTKGKYKKRGQIFALVTNRPSRKSKGVVSIVTGYSFKKDSEVKVKIAGKSFTLFTSGDRAWTPDAKTDKRMVSAMVKGSRMIVDGVSSKGTKTTDTYSLSGFTKARKAIDKACKM
ncbi:MAG: hypothetical protein HOL85_06135 [Rhodospirillaceae bacterium]|nr:hypothetical protein [Rhodospirillaceae bacterium]MBT6137472.1 hypothetical protein [Rhodospirillaceae bacterium]